MKKKKRPLTEAEKKARQRERLRLWRERNPDYNKQWRKKHKLKVRGYKRQWRAKPENVERERELRRGRNDSA